MFSTKPIIEEEISEITFESAIDNCYANSDFKRNLLLSNVLIIPSYEDANKKKNVFPINTTELYRYLSQKSPSQINLDIATTDEDYLELTQNCDVVTLPTIILSGVTLPIITGIIANYISDKMNPENTIIKSDIIVQEEGKSKLLKYDGPAKYYDNTLSKFYEK